MTSETPTAYQITPEDIAALTAADSVTCHFYNGRGYIRVYRRTFDKVYSVKDQRLFSITDAGTGDRARDIDTETRMFGYGDDASVGWLLGDLDGAVSEPSGYASMSGGQYNDHWRTVVSLLRKGDTLRLAWVAGNSNGYLADAGLCRDELSLVIVRGDKTLHFSICTGVTADNSARMIKRYGERAIW